MNIYARRAANRARKRVAAKHGRSFSDQKRVGAETEAWDGKPWPTMATSAPFVGSNGVSNRASNGHRVQQFNDA